MIHVLLFQEVPPLKSHQLYIFFSLSSLNAVAINASSCIFFSVSILSLSASILSVLNF